MILATIDFSNFNDFYCIAVKICIRDVIFLLLGQLLDLPHAKIDFWTYLMNFKFYELWKVKDQ